MATAGALVGASIAGLAYKLSGQNYTVTFALATVPATLALLLTISVSHLVLHHIVQALHTGSCSACVGICNHGLWMPMRRWGQHQGSRSVKGAERVGVCVGIQRHSKVTGRSKEACER